METPNTAQQEEPAVVPEGVETPKTEETKLEGQQAPVDEKVVLSLLEEIAAPALAPNPIQLTSPRPFTVLTRNSNVNAPKKFQKVSTMKK